MEENLQQGIDLLTKCFELIRSNNNEGVKYATDQIDSLVTNPFSIHILINFFKLQDDPIVRQFGLISLKCTIKNCWSSIPLETRSQLFRNILNLLINETVWVNRIYLIDCIKISMVSELDEILISFLKEAYMTGNDQYLEIALLLSTLIPTNTDQIQEYSNIIPFFQEMLIKGLNSDQPEIRIAGFHFICYSKLFCNAHFFEQSPDYWLKVIELFDSFITDSQQLNRLVSYFDYCIQERIYAGDPTSLLLKLMSFFAYQPPIDENELLNLHTLIQTICTIYAQDLSTSEILAPLIDLHIFMSFRLFNSEDSFTLSNAQFFEESFRTLCINQYSIDVLWSKCLMHVDKNEGLFVFLRAVASTFDNAPKFYYSHIREITDILRTSILSNSPLLRDAAARTADELIKYYVFESDELSIDLAPIVVNACHDHVSADLLQVCSRILETTNKTDIFFDETFPFMLNLVLNNSQPDIQDAALRCLGSLAQWSTTKINRDFKMILPMLCEILKSSADHHQYLKSPAVDFIGKLAEVVGRPLDNFLTAVNPFFIENIDNDDVALALSCMNTIKLIIKSHPETIANGIAELVPKLQKYASTDLSQEFLKYLNLGGTDHEVITKNVLKLSGLSLQVLGAICENMSNQNEELLIFVYKCCDLHKNSSDQFCQSSVAITISSITHGFFEQFNNSNNDKNLEEEIKKTIYNFLMLILGYLSPKLNMEVNFDIYRTLNNIVFYFCYDFFKRDELQKILNITCEFLSPEVSLNYRPQERLRDVYAEIFDFLKNIFISANKDSPNLLTNVTDKYYQLLNVPNSRFRSFAIRYFGYLITTNSDDIQASLQQDIMKMVIQMAQNDDEYGAFVAIQQIADQTPELMKPYQDQVYEILMKKLSMPFVKTEGMLLLRDNCVIALAIFATSYNGYKPIDLQNCAPIVLKALPIFFPIGDRKMRSVSIFFLKMYEECKTLYPYDFLRALVVTFANPRSVIDEMEFKQYEPILINCLKELMELPDAVAKCVEILNDDASKLEFLQDNLKNE